MAWEKIFGWEYDRSRHVHELNGNPQNLDWGDYDLAAEVKNIGRNHWRIRYWSGPNVGAAGMNEMKFDGTVDEAKAVAVAMVRI